MRQITIHATATTPSGGGIVRTLCRDAAYVCNVSGALDQITCILCLDALQLVYHGEEEGRVCPSGGEAEGAGMICSPSRWWPAGLLPDPTDSKKKSLSSIGGVKDSNPKLDSTISYTDPDNADEVVPGLGRVSRLQIRASAVRRYAPTHRNHSS